MKTLENMVDAAERMVQADPMQAVAVAVVVVVVVVALYTGAMFARRAGWTR